ncbi:Tubulin-tyrosine ligase family protein [Tritrichomonas foetus]|uniref:Tubulin-tyrosine ligase family protein n=1 Tax=Tritrichomonas foetus TaxID=1144522 RepID=A0A1J4K1L2_9EUKA|nr:Tubulin-tyrosine ligase family protein [Tritrichomonas foetus]|eukprot:OHT03365.1 Tubulin-tyrosine ligase family protein [Tritrichomonas foetus]
MYPVGTQVDQTRARYFTGLDAMKDAGLVPAPENSNPPLIWIDGIMSIEEAEKLLPYQRVNKIPCMDYICFKSTLFDELNNLRKKYPNIMNFYPLTYNLPNDYPELQRQHSFICGRKNTAPTWVIKPRNGSCGKGIYLIQSSYEASNITKSSVAQQMVDPLLLDGFKFDFRLYLLVSSIEPFTAFIYKEGVARFCTEPYSPPTKSNRDHVFMNLTNTAINVGSSKSPEQFTRPASEVIQRIIKTYPAAKNIWNSIIDLSRMLLGSIYPTIIATLPHNGGKKFRHHVSDPDSGEDGKPRNAYSARAQTAPQNMRNSMKFERMTSSRLGQRKPTVSMKPLNSPTSVVEGSPQKVENYSQNTENTPKIENNIENERSSEIKTDEPGQTDEQQKADDQQKADNNPKTDELVTNENNSVNQNSENDQQEDVFVNLLPSQHYFQLLGIDIIIGSDLKPKLLELNDRPSIAVTVPFEKDLKTNMMREMFYHVTPNGSTLGNHENSGWQQIIPIENPNSDIFLNVKKVMNTPSSIKYIGRVAANSPSTNRMVSSGINNDLHTARRKRAAQLRESAKAPRFNNYLKPFV